MINILQKNRQTNKNFPKQIHCDKYTRFLTLVLNTKEKICVYNVIVLWLALRSISKLSKSELTQMASKSPKISASLY